MKLCTQKMLN